MEKQKRKINIYMRSYFDVNLGDDLMIKGILKKYRHINFYVDNRSLNIKKYFSGYDNLYFLKKKTNVINSFTKYDMFLTLGGSVYQYRNLRDILSRFFKLFIVLIFKMRKKPVISLGNNFGPIDLGIGHKLLEFEINKTDLLTVRDEISYNLAKHYSHVFLVDDIVTEFEYYRTSFDNRKNKEIIGYSVYNFSNEEKNKKEIKMIIDSIEKYNQENTSYRFYIIAFNSHQEGDDLIVENILSYFEDEDIDVQPLIYKGDLERMLFLFQEIDLLYGLRFHSIILSEMFNIDFVPLSYSNKTQDYIKANYAKDAFSISYLYDNKVSLNDLPILKSSDKIQKEVHSSLKLFDDFLKKI